MNQMPEICFEDFEIGQKIVFNKKTLSKQEIIHFAKQFDPAPFHLDEEAGKASILGGLAASGWHVCSIAMKMICETYMLKSSGQGSPGIGKCQWLAPVLAGDTLSGHIIIENTRHSKSKPDLGVVEISCHLFNQHDKKVLFFTNTALFKLRSSL